MTRLFVSCVLALTAAGASATPAQGQSAGTTLAPAPGGVASTASEAATVTYELSFPHPEHHWMQVDATFQASGPVRSSCA